MTAPRTRTYESDSHDEHHDVPAPGALACQPGLWRDLFGNARPVEVEIGCAKGPFLLAAARAAPQRNFMGFERSPRLAAAAQQALENAHLENARVLCCDARCIVTYLIPSGSVAAYHLYFPDPWWKRRHHKRRVYSPGFVAAVARTLIPQGRIFVATDIPTLLEALGHRLAAAGLRPHPPSAIPPSTSFAARCIAVARPVHCATFVLP